MTFGGFLGIGSHEHTIPWDKLDYDTRLGGYRTDITEEQLRELQACSATARSGRIAPVKRRCMITGGRALTGVVCEASKTGWMRQNRRMGDQVSWSWRCTMALRRIAC